MFNVSARGAGLVNECQSASVRSALSGDERTAHGVSARFFQTLLTTEYLVVAAAILVGLCYRLTIGWSAPFWLDESYTGTIASQPSFEGLLRWSQNELSGPFFYGGMWIWEKLAGNSDLALRLPSLILSLAVIVLMATTKGLDRRDRLLWAGVTAVWIPGLQFAALARPQALLFLLATVQAIAFMRCINGCNTRRLAVWSAVTTLLLLTHLHSAVIGGLQLLFLAWTYRLGLLKFWPALLVFLIPVPWLALQLSVVGAFLKPGVASYKILQLRDLPTIPFDLFGWNLAAFVVPLLVLALVGKQVNHYLRSGTRPPYSRAESMLVLSAVISIALVAAIGMFRSSYFPRYLIPYMPATLFGVVIILRRARLLAGVLPIAVLWSWTVDTAVDAWKFHTDETKRQKVNVYEFQRGSEWLMARNARRVLFIWANPVSGFNDRTLQSEMAGFFFRRANYHAQVSAVHLKPSQLTSSYLALLARRHDAAILWIDDNRRPWAVQKVPGLDCIRFAARTSKSRKVRPPGRSMACAPPSG